MTTIAYKDGVIAYDSRVTRGDLITDDDCDKCIERDGVNQYGRCGAQIRKHAHMIGGGIGR